MLKRILFLFAFALLAVPFVFGQITTSSITGSVKSTTDEVLVGATVVATHVPSGTKYTAVSRAGGVIRIDNMQPGGPYSIEVTFVGYNKEKYDDIYLQLAESFILNPTMAKAAQTLENVVLTTGRRNVFNPNRTGAVTNIGLRQITSAATVSRSINDLTRATPQSFSNSFGGGNYRQSNFTVDGADFNNSFGIGTGNLPAGGSPISLDALDEISVSITPFDVRQSGFIGAAINAVTRAGTNTFSGSVYTYYRTERLRGRRVEKTYFVRAPETYNLYGFRLGGPIIKNKLFFFFNYEKDKTPRTIQTRVAATAAAPYGSGDNVARPTADSLNYISQYLKDNYGYVTGKFDNYTPNVERTKVLGRIDWNINNKNRAVFRYSQVVGGTPLSMSSSLNSANGNGNVAGFSPTTNGLRTANTGLWFEKSNYFQGENFYSLSAELNSKIGNSSNMLRGTYTFQDEDRASESQVFPFVDILSTGGGVSTQNTQGYGVLGVPYTSFGYEPFTFGNLRKVKTYSVIDNFSWTRKKHSWIIGAQYDNTSVINGFQPFGTSYYRFATWADFASALNPNPQLRKLPTDFVITYSLSKDFAPAFSAYKYSNYSLYGQDEIALTRNFRLTLGLRLELPTYPKSPQIITNPMLLALNFADGEKINTGVLPKDKVTISPRVGFNWDVYGDRSLQIRGGTGLFIGKVPAVWVVGQSGNSAMIQLTQGINTYDASGNYTGILPPGPFDPNPIAYRPASVPAAGTSVNANAVGVARNFKNPCSWKSTLAMDTKLPWGIIATLEAIFNKDVRTIFPVNVNLQKPQPLNTSTYNWDNRMIYGGTAQTRFINTLNGAFVPTPGASGAFNPIVLHNGGRGYYFSLTAKFEKTLTKGFAGSVAYTKSIAGNLHDGGGDQLSGVWQGTPTINGSNTTPLSYADYVVPDRVVALLSYRREWLKHLATSISLIYNGSSNGRFSYVYGGDFNRDGVNGNDLIWIPTAAQVQQMTFTSRNVNGVSYDGPTQRSLFEAYIQQDKYLRTHRGQYAERGGGLMPWYNRVDVKLAQDLFVKVGKNKNTFQFTADIINAGNIINPSWGKLKIVNATSILSATLPAGFGPGGTVAPTFQLATANNQMVTRTFRDNVSVSSTYSVQFGLRYIFN